MEDELEIFASQVREKSLHGYYRQSQQTITVWTFVHPLLQSLLSNR